MQKQHFNWEVHQDLMSNIINFLEHQNLKPSKLIISGDGWAEAYFLVKHAHKNSRWWTKLEKRRLIELRQPILEMQIAGGTALRVEFRLAKNVQIMPRLQRLLQFA